MKKITVLLSVLFLFLSVFQATDTLGQKTEKQIKKDLKKRPPRIIKKQAKKLVKEGWFVSPGSPPLEKMLEKAEIRQFEEDEKGNMKYIFADGTAIAGNKTAAELAAVESGKLILAGMLETRVAALISQNIANTELSEEEAESVNEMIASSKNIIAKNIGYINPFFKIYRKLENKNIEVAVKLFYNSEEAEVMAKKVVRKQLKEKLKTNEEDLRKLMGM